MMWMPFTIANLTNAIQVGIVQNSGFDADGGSRCVNFGSTRDDAGRGDGERRGCEVV